MKKALKKEKANLLIVGRNSTFLRNTNIYGGTPRKVLMSAPKCLFW
ncbi:hypothetical protein PY092_13260 [Muricauda sp. 334s03]|uniref:Universal stress protein n=1 Tax=Flagellimonas yonaguniensis TaxID=3031325 RepID=A0ABT5Y104_9FLAO|nr:hypothetical protein [[Muricauda] yonaguniensis]MDF0717125.1 hypothetical protein [[Muricauda] yonaguniensis]